MFVGNVPSLATINGSKVLNSRRGSEVNGITEKQWKKWGEISVFYELIIFD